MKFSRYLVAVLAVLSFSTVAFAQEAPVSSTDETPAASVSSSAGRFRWGVNGTTGLESVGANGESVSGMMFGLDLRLGWQLNEMFAIYAQPHLSFGSLGTSTGGVAISGGTGTFIGTVMGEATFSDMFYAGAGVGYGVLNNPSGFAVEARGGFYPWRWRGDDGVHRKGLMVGADVRSVFVSGATGLMFMACIGYESF